MPTWEVGRIAAVSASVEQAVRRVRGELEMLRESGRAVPRRVTIEVKVLDSGQYLAKVVGPWVEPDRSSPRRRAVSQRRQAATRPEGRKDDEAAA
jgi:hypothetical protein